MPALTRQLAAFASRTRFVALPAAVQAEAVRAFENWMGCVLGGCSEPAVGIAAAASGAGGRAESSIIGRWRRTGVASAAFVNCLSSSVLAFDNTHPLGRAEAVVEVTLADGRHLRAHVVDARGSVARPMTDAELDAKFTAQARAVLFERAAEALLRRCRQAPALRDVGAEVAACWA